MPFARIDWGDGTAYDTPEGYVATGTLGPLAFGAGSLYQYVDPSLLLHTYTSEGTFTITVTIYYPSSGRSLSGAFWPYNTVAAIGTLEVDITWDTAQPFWPGFDLTHRPSGQDLKFRVIKR